MPESENTGKDHVDFWASKGAINLQRQLQQQQLSKTACANPSSLHTDSVTSFQQQNNDKKHKDKKKKTLENNKNELNDNKDNDKEDIKNSTWQPVQIAHWRRDIIAAANLQLKLPKMLTKKVMIA